MSTLKKQLKEQQRALDAYKVILTQMEQEKHEYAIRILDLCKRKEINVSAQHKKLKTAPWTTGKEQYDKEQAEAKKKADKKNKKKKH